MNSAEEASIINHQRHLPPSDRYGQAYRDEIIKNAEQTQLGLLTTWDLFKLLRNAEKLGWPTEVVLPIFYRVGRIDPIPEHYIEVGRILEVWQPAFGINPTQPITIGHRIAVEIGDTFDEFNLTSLRVDENESQTAPVGSNCGVKYDDPSTRLRKGARVFLVNHAAMPREKQP